MSGQEVQVEKMLVQIDIPEDVTQLIRILESHGHEAYVVGGCVRDSLLNLSPRDWDLTTNAQPVQMQNYFNEFARVITTGLKHGTITVILNGHPYEITAYRDQGHTPDSFSLSADLARRDFTINAMAYHETKGLKDYFNGKGDLENKIIRAVLSPSRRFQEDPLRMMRAVRLATVLDFNIEEETFWSIAQNREKMGQVSPERIRDELMKMVMSNQPSKALNLLNQVQLLQYILPALHQCIGILHHNPHHDQDVFGHTLKVVENTPPILTVRLAALFHDIGKPSAFTLGPDGRGHFYGHEKESERLTRQILTQLRFDHQTIEKVCLLVKIHMLQAPVNDKKAIRKWIHGIGENNLEAFFILQRADRLASAQTSERDLQEIFALQAQCRLILQENPPLAISDLAIGGKDLIQLGLEPGTKMGAILTQLLEHVLENPTLNQREILLNLAQRLIQGS